MRSDRSDMVAGTDLLRDKAKAALERMVEANPANQGALLKLGEICRQQGQLDEALGYYRRFIELRPEQPRESLLCSILSGTEPPPAVAAGLRPAPWVRVSDFLSGDELDRVWEHVRRKHAEFSPAKVGEAGLDQKLRISMLLYEEDLDDLAPWFLAGVEARLAELWPRLLMEPVPITRREIQLTRHMDGAFFKVHTDTGDDSGPEVRAITFVYYFCRLPKRFEGGDLLLFDTDVEEGQPSMGFTRLSPDHNSLLLFPSRFFHQVTPVHCDSDEFEHGRFTINGWLNVANPKQGSAGSLDPER